VSQLQLCCPVRQYETVGRVSLLQDVGVNVEVKMATSGALPETPQQEVCRVVDPIVKVLVQCAGQRQLYVSSFDPDIVKAVSWHRKEGRLVSLPRLSLWFLTAGGSQQHADSRRMSVAAAVTFATETAIDGIVAETEVARQQRLDVGAALERGLKVSYTTCRPAKTHTQGVG